MSMEDKIERYLKGQKKDGKDLVEKELQEDILKKQLEAKRYEEEIKPREMLLESLVGELFNELKNDVWGGIGDIKKTVCNHDYNLTIAPYFKFPFYSNMKAFQVDAYDIGCSMTRYHRFGTVIPGFAGDNPYEDVEPCYSSYSDSISVMMNLEKGIMKFRSIIMAGIIVKNIDYKKTEFCDSSFIKDNSEHFNYKSDFVVDSNGSKSIVSRIEKMPFEKVTRLLLENAELLSYINDFFVRFAINSKNLKYFRDDVSFDLNNYYSSNYWPVNYVRRCDIEEFWNNFNFVTGKSEIKKPVVVEVPSFRTKLNKFFGK